MDAPAQPTFERLQPVSDEYAQLPIAEAFNWSDCAASAGVGEWYLVAFRSTIRPDADLMRLEAFDDRAHAEAGAAPGFVHYFKGPLDDRGRCLSFCLWDSRVLARKASGRPAHALAAAIVHETYQTYALEFHRVRKRHGSTMFEFEAYDRPDLARSA